MIPGNKFKKFIRKCVGIPTNEDLSINNMLHHWRLKYGPMIYKRKYSANDVVTAMCKAGMKEGSVVFIQSSWSEFYNCTSSEEELIAEILKAIGPEGTLAMACMPLMRKGKVFNVKKTVTSAGLLAETFRKYPGVKRSIHERHSVCAIGPQADYLLSEHHLGETAWDKKSPYYKLSTIGALIFGLGLGKYWVGTIIHCVDSLLKDEIPYYHDLFFSYKTEYRYIDYDGQEKTYWNYDMPETGSKIRVGSYFKNRHICRKYLHNHYQQVSNLQISCWNADEVVPVLVNLGRRGIDSNLLPSKKGYKFDK